MAIWDSIGQIITTAIGGAISTDANSRAAQIASDATLQGAQVGADAIRDAATIAGETTLKGAQYGSDLIRDYTNKAGETTIQGADISADAIRGGSEQAIAILNELRRLGAPGTSYLQGVVADPGSLTPTQQGQLEDLRRSVANQIHSSNFAGSGRTAAALFRKTEADFTNAALDSNRDRAMQAAGTLHGDGTQAATGSANLVANTGKAVGDVYGDAYTRVGGYQANAGQASGNLYGGAYNNVATMQNNAGVNTAKLMSDATSRAGLLEANAETANGKISGEAIGSIGSVIANEARASRYGDRMKKIEQALGVG